MPRLNKVFVWLGWAYFVCAGISAFAVAHAPSGGLVARLIQAWFLAPVLPGLMACGSSDLFNCRPIAYILVGLGFGWQVLGWWTFIQTSRQWLRHLRQWLRTGFPDWLPKVNAVIAGILLANAITMLLGAPSPEIQLEVAVVIGLGFTGFLVWFNKTYYAVISGTVFAIIVLNLFQPGNLDRQLAMVVGFGFTAFLIWFNKRSPRTWYWVPNLNTTIAGILVAIGFTIVFETACGCSLPVPWSVTTGVGFIGLFMWLGKTSRDTWAWTFLIFGLESLSWAIASYASQLRPVNFPGQKPFIIPVSSSEVVWNITLPAAFYATLSLTLAYSLFRLVHRAESAHP